MILGCRQGAHVIALVPPARSIAYIINGLWPQFASYEQDKKCSLFVSKLDWLAAILWKEHLLPLTDIDRYELSVLQVSSSWAG